jgi:predicted nucleic acid-binding protein
VAVLFLDTSALVRRYDPAEPGAARVRTLLRRSSGHAPVIADITPIEIGSAFGRKHREGILAQDELRRLWRLFRAHWRTQYQVVALDEREHRREERLAARTGPMILQTAVGSVPASFMRQVA